MFKKILVPLDGSGLAAKILPQVEELAKDMHADVTLITIGNTLTMGGTDEIVTAAYKDFCAQMRVQAEKTLTKNAKVLAAKNIKVAWKYMEGAAAAEIIAYAEDNGFDLIAMATHGFGEAHWAIGSVADKVVRHATVPVLLLRVLSSGPTSARTGRTNI